MIRASAHITPLRYCLGFEFSITLPSSEEYGRYAEIRLRISVFSFGIEWFGGEQ